jgi:hypothetical protein
MFLETVAWDFAVFRSTKAFTCYFVRVVGIYGHGGFFDLRAAAGMSSSPFSLIFLSVLVMVCPVLQFPYLWFSFLHDGQGSRKNPSPPP